nr:hyoscyamine 6-dioxygenase-like [Ipomoea batatas]GME11632.1 hyoscyamine 6-dioxygenase-like [Ipomoea batatas]
MASTLLKNIPAEDFKVPPHKRAVDFSADKRIPVIDLAAHNRADLAQQIIKSAKEFGVFQVSNHGVSEKVMEEAMNLYKQVFSMGDEEKAMLYGEGSNKNCRIHAGGDYYLNAEYRSWREMLIQPVSPMDDESMQSKPWLEKPAGYREMVIAYTTEMKMLGLRILDLIGEALGMEAGYFDRNNLTQTLNIVANHYPVCPDPSSTMGSAPHYDPNLITILHQQLFGLQIFNNGQWLGVEPLPHALTIMVSSQLQIISNDELKGCKHRVVTNSSAARVSIGTFIGPSNDAVVEPAAAVVNAAAGAAPVFRPVQYKEFLQHYITNKTESDVVDFCKIQP